MHSTDLFPYRFRPGQGELVRFISSTVDDGMNPVVEAGTGTGKTVSALSATLPTALERTMKVIYLTRTKSQQKQVIRESAAIGHGVLCVALQGRTAASCPMMRDDPDLASGTSEEISKLCSEYKRRDNGECRCRFYANIEHADIGEWVERIRTEHPEPEGNISIKRTVLFVWYISLPVSWQRVKMDAVNMKTVKKLYVS